MFGGLFGKKESQDQDHLFKDRAYMNINAKMKACADLAKENEQLIFIAWFSYSLKEFRKYFSENGISENRVIDAKTLTTAQLQSYTPVFVEHYPMHSKEEQLVSSWKVKNIIVYSSMDEPLFKHFGSEKLIPLMKMLGMKENEVIEHSMVSKSIINGQHKIEEMVTVEQSASSQLEWMERNIKK